MATAHKSDYARTHATATVVKTQIQHDSVLKIIGPHPLVVWKRSLLGSWLFFKHHVWLYVHNWAVTRLRHESIHTQPEDRINSPQCRSTSCRVAWLRNHIWCATVGRLFASATSAALSSTRRPLIHRLGFGVYQRACPVSSPEHVRACSLLRYD